MPVAATSMLVFKYPDVSNIQPGDLMIMQVDTSAAPVINTPSGWNQYFATANGTICKQSIFWKIATASDINTQSYQVTFGVASTARATIHVFRGVDVTDPANFGRTSTTGTSVSPTSLTLSTPSPNCVLLHMVAVVNNANVTPPPTFAEVQDSAAPPPANTIRGQSSHKTIAASGNTGTFAASVSTSAGWVVTTIALPSTDYAVIRSVTTAVNTLATERRVVPLKPTGATFKDVLFAFVKVDSTSAVVIQEPTFIPITSVTSGTHKFYLYYKVLTANEPTGYQFSRDTFGYIAMILVCVRNSQDGGDVVSAFSAVATASGTNHSTSLTTLNNNSLLLGFFSEIGNNAGTTLITPPTGMTERAEIQLMEAADVIQPTAGPSGTKTAVFTVTAAGMAALLELRPRQTTDPSVPAWDASSYWGSPSLYWPAPAPEWDATKFYGVALYPMEAETGVDLVIQALAHAHTVQNQSVVQNSNIILTNLAHAHSNQSISITQAHNITAENLSHAHTNQSIAITQVHNLTLAQLAHAHTVEPLSVTLSFDLVLSALSHASTIESQTLAQAHNLTTANLAHGSTVQNISITQVHSVAVSGTAHGHSVQSLILTQVHNLTTAGLSHGSTVDSAAITVQYTLAVQSSAHAQALESLTVVYSYALTLAGLAHAHSITSPVLTQAHNVAVDGARHAQTAEAFSFTQVHNLTAQNLNHPQQVEAPNVTITYILEPQSTSHGHTIGSPVLTLTFILAVEDAHHAALSEAFSLTQVHNLTTFNLSHTHTLSMFDFYVGNTATSGERTHRVGFETRSFIIALEPRSDEVETRLSYVVESEDRTFTVAVENRTIDAEDTNV